MACDICNQHIWINQGTASVHTACLDAIRADERAKIVAFLREYAEPRDEGTWHINDAADRIERSEHLPEKK